MNKVTMLHVEKEYLSPTEIILKPDYCSPLLCYLKEVSGGDVFYVTGSVTIWENPTLLERFHGITEPTLHKLLLRISFKANDRLVGEFFVDPRGFKNKTNQSDHPWWTQFVHTSK